MLQDEVHAAVQHYWPPIILEFLKVLLSTQMVAGICIVVVVVSFQTELRDLIKRIRRIRATGVGELSASGQAERLEATGTGPVASVAISAAAISTPESDMSLEDLRAQVRAAESVSLLWEYRYLNYYLVAGTQATLDWFAGLNPRRTTLNVYDASLTQLVPDPSERNARLSALVQHNLVTREGEFLQISPKGEQYRTWRANILPPRSM